MVVLESNISVSPWLQQCCHLSQEHFPLPCDLRICLCLRKWGRACAFGDRKNLLSTSYSIYLSVLSLNLDKLYWLPGLCCETDSARPRLPGLSVKVWSMQRLWVSIGDAILTSGLTLMQWTVAAAACALLNCCCAKNKLLKTAIKQHLFELSQFLWINSFDCSIFLAASYWSFLFSLYLL